MSKSAFYAGEGLAGEGNEIAHIDLLVGRKDGPLGPVFGDALARQTAGHSNLLAVLAPNKVVKPDTVMFTKVTIKGAKQAVQMFGPAQAAVAWAVGDELVAGSFKDLADDPNDLCIVAGVFIHWEAADDGKIFAYNYEATRLAIQRAVVNGPSIEEVTKWVNAGESDESLAHPFLGKDVKLCTSLKELRAKFTKK